MHRLSPNLTFRNSHQHVRPSSSSFVKVRKRKSGWSSWKNGRTSTVRDPFIECNGVWDVWVCSRECNFARQKSQAGLMDHLHLNFVLSNAINTGPWNHSVMGKCWREIPSSTVLWPCVQVIVRKPWKPWVLLLQDDILVFCASTCSVRCYSMSMYICSERTQFWSDLVVGLKNSLHLKRVWVHGCMRSKPILTGLEKLDATVRESALYELVLALKQQVIDGVS